MEKVKCPYCEKTFSKLCASHMNTHGKTLNEAFMEHQEIPKRFWNRLTLLKTVYNPNICKPAQDYFFDKATDIQRGKQKGLGYSKWHQNKSRSVSLRCS